MIKVATFFYEPKNNKTSKIPNYYIEETIEWIVFPHELEDIMDEEIFKSKRENIVKIINNIKKNKKT